MTVNRLVLLGFFLLAGVPAGLLAVSGKANNLIQSWLELQCGMMAGAIRAVVLFPESGGSHYRPVAGWPSGVTATPALSSAAASALQQQKIILRDRASAAAAAGQEGDIVACPLLRSGQICGVVAVEATSREAAQQKLLAEMLGSGSAWLDLLLSDRSSVSENRLLSIVEIVAATLEHDELRAAASTFVTHLAARLKCERVSLGFLRGHHVRVEVVSRSASMDRRTKLVTAIGAAMEEAIDQDTTVLFPDRPEEKFQVVRAHSELAAQHGGRSICTVPMVHQGELIGAVTLEHQDPERFNAEVLTLCETIVALVGPILEDRRRQGRWLDARLAREARTLGQKLFGAGNLFPKLVGACAAALATLSVFATAEYRVTADATLEGTVQRAVVAPFSGFIAEANVRPGDIVSEGQVLAALDDKDLTLERLTIASEKSQYEKEYREALAAHESAQVAILRAQLDKATAQLQLIEEQLARTQVLAPLDGVIINGDLSQSLGAPVERGDALFEVAPLDSYRVMLEVDETLVGELEPGQSGRLALAGFPADYLLFVVERITPISTAADGRNYFTIEARLEDTPELLRPGMQGVGKIDIGTRRVVWIWTHRLTDWFRLWSWSWMPWK
ncbi:MAG: HlyD family efflux transporter periplasmic adaptor subunit [Gammaproteobacteria bacterium]